MGNIQETQSEVACRVAISGRGEAADAEGRKGGRREEERRGTRQNLATPHAEGGEKIFLKNWFRNRY